MKKESSENEAGCRQQTDQHKEKQVWRDAGEKEMDLEETDTKQEGKQRELSERERAGVSWGKELGGGCRVEPEKNNESPLPPTKTAMSAVPPPPTTHPPPAPSTPPDPLLPSLSVAAPFMLSPSDCLNSLLLFNSLGRSQGHSRAHHPATSKHPNIYTHAHTHTLKFDPCVHSRTCTNTCLCVSLKVARGRGDGGGYLSMQTVTQKTSKTVSRLHWK